jgi:hypothetical protein
MYCIYIRTFCSPQNFLLLLSLYWRAHVVPTHRQHVGMFPHSDECLPTSRAWGLIAEVEVEVTLRPTISRPVRLGVRRPSATRDQFYFLLEIFFRQLRVCNFVEPSVTRARVCNLLYNCLLAFPEHSLLGRSPTELAAILYCLI